MNANVNEKSIKISTSPGNCETNTELLRKNAMN